MNSNKKKIVIQNHKKKTISKKTKRIIKATPDSKEIFHIPQIAKEWKEIAPMLRSTRRKLHESCIAHNHEDKCFLDIRKSKTGKMIFKYPVCSGNDCKIQYQGILAAINATFRVENKFKQLSKNDKHAQDEIKRAQKIRRKAMKLLKTQCQTVS